MEGAGGTLYSDCEVFPMQGLNSDVILCRVRGLTPPKVPRDLSGAAIETISIHEPVIYAMHKSINNHYHWIAESLGR